MSGNEELCLSGATDPVKVAERYIEVVKERHGIPSP
jgi:hypothetical protein